MTREEKFILRKIKNEDFVLTTHALKRMSQRHLTDLDIIEVATNLKYIRRQDQNNTYLLKGHNSWGEALSVVAAVRNNVIIVTIFFEVET